MIKKIYLAVLLVGLVVCGWTVVDRMGAERSADSVEMILDYEEVKLLAEQSEHSVQWWMTFFKNQGFHSVALKEETMENLVADHKPLEYTVSGKLKDQVGWEADYGSRAVAYIEEKTDRFDLVARTDDETLFQFIQNGLRARYPVSFFQTFAEDGRYTIVLDGTADDALYSNTGVLKDEDGKAKRTLRNLSSTQLAWIGFGFDAEKIDLIQKTGLEVAPRPANFERHSEKLVDAFMSEMEAYDLKPDLLVFQGESVTGYPEKEQDLYTYMHENKIAPGLIETGVQRAHTKQEGLLTLTERLDYQAVRVFPIVGYIQYRWQYYGYDGAEEIENTMYRAITERNIRAVYFRPFKETKSEHMYITDPEAYEQTFESLKARLDDHGIAIGSSSTMAYNEPGILRLIVLGISLVVFGLITLHGIIPFSDRSHRVLAALGSLGVTGALFVAPNLSASLMALGSAVLFPVLAGVVLIELLRGKLAEPQVWRLRDIAIHALGAVLLTTTIVTIGGLYVGAVLSSSEYLLEIEFFRGVKLSQMAPLATLPVIYILKLGYRRSTLELAGGVRFVEDIKALLQEPIKVIYVLVGIAAAVVGYVYIARTGHETSIQPSQLEMIFRNMMEMKLIARPRSKEMLLAFPSVVMAIYLAAKGWKQLVFPFAVVAMVGFASVVNTFSHLRAPVYLSFFRTILGAGFGAVLGLIAIVGLDILYRSYHGRKHHE